MRNALVLSLALAAGCSTSTAPHTAGPSLTGTASLTLMGDGPSVNFQVQGQSGLDVDGAALDFVRYSIPRAAIVSQHPVYALLQRSRH